VECEHRLTDAHVRAIKSTLANGWPVCGGLRWPKQEKWVEDVLQLCPPDAVRDGHSVLLVGYRDYSALPGGGVFIFRNTANAGRDGFMPYAYARDYMNDAVWIDCPSRSETAVPPSVGSPAYKDPLNVSLRCRPVATAGSPVTRCPSGTMPTST